MSLKINLHDYSEVKCDNMANLRQEIDYLDQRLVELLTIRQGYMKQAAHIKQDRNIVRDEDRVQDVLNKVKQHSDKIGANKNLIELLYKEMIEWCINYELDIFDQIHVEK